MITLFDKFKKKKNNKSAKLSVDDYVYIPNQDVVGIIAAINTETYSVLVDDDIYNYDIDSVDNISHHLILMTPERVEQWKLEKDVDKYNL